MNYLKFVYVFKLVNFLFDAITYLLKYFETSSVICQNNMFYVQKQLNLNTVQTLKCLSRELNVEFLTNLHNGQANSEVSYVGKMLILAKDEGLWGAYTTIFQISKYFHHPIYVWNKFNEFVTMCN